MAREIAIETRELRLQYGEIKAVDGVDLEVEAGIIYRPARPERRRQDDTIRILTTLLEPDSGTARVAGLDVVRDAARLRERIGLAGQYAAVDDNLTGFENLEMVGVSTTSVAVWRASTRAGCSPTST